MASQGIDSVYVMHEDPTSVAHRKISGKELFGCDPLHEDLYYGYETTYAPFEKYYVGRREHIDLVLSDYRTNTLYSALEIKLTAIPDSTTLGLPLEKQGTELVVRPSTICFLACSICEYYQNRKTRLKDLLGTLVRVKHWDSAQEVLPFYVAMETAIWAIAADMKTGQKPLILQPVWRTEGNSLAEECLDIIVWSNLASIHLFAQGTTPDGKLNRTHRSVVWLYKMLWDFVVYDHFEYEEIINDLSYEVKNDKAFSVSGSASASLIQCHEIQHPRIRRAEISRIILGGGERFLSPERRLDAMIVNSPDLFS